MSEETATQTTLEPAEPQELVKYADQTGLDPTSAKTLVHSFRPVYIQAHEAIAAAQGVAESVLDATCVTEIRKSRACRLAIRAARIEAERIHKANKEQALRFGKAVDGFKNILLAELVPVEEALRAAEETAERAEAARKAALKASREAELAPYLDGSPILTDLSALTPEAWQKLLADHQLLRQAKIDAAAKAKAERLAREEEAKRIAQENERLKKEAEAREAAAKAEREEAARTLAAERAEAARLALEEKARADAEAKRMADRAAAERAAIEAKAKAEREEAEVKAREESEKLKLEAEVERRKLAKAQAENKALKAAEEKKRAQEAAEVRRATAAPDRIKIKLLSGKLREMSAVNLANEDIAGEILKRVNELADWCEQQADKL